ncbi:multicopy suppressor of BFA (Brefeldin A) [Malassezia yamatoensis]|uniref:Multicopy suppressor of BFA (Brefeldin A) n=1 Tax=Malassezia yamatoensis TaxID=253288 RepID=A0AAJ6CKU4_9BASI|nr:multicopy suppressor of BFA (Brefeldin A) [Malassezia yamatoensis]
MVEENTQATKHEPTVAAGVHIVKLPGGKPDQKAHNEEMERIKAEINQVQQKVNKVRDALSGASTDTPAGKRRAELRAELDALRSQQAGHKGTRGKVFDEIKALQDEIASKVKSLQAAKSKAPFKSQSEVDAQIAQIESQIESGSMKIVEERKALNEISILKRSRKSMDSLSAQQSQIDSLRTEVEKLRGSLDDPESQAISRRYDEIKRELDSLNQEQEKTVGSRSKLLSQRNALSKQLDDLYQSRRDRLNAYHAENDKYYARMNAEREKRQEAQRKEREDAEAIRQAQEDEEIRENAALPAFAKEIEDCDVLIRYFSGNDSSSASSTSAELNGKEANGKLPSLPGVRESNSEIPEGAVIAPRKGEEDNYFVAGAGKKKSSKGKKNKGTKLSLNDEDASSSPSTPGGSLHVPFGMLSALLALSIPPPMNQADLSRVVDNVKLKREYFLSNQARATKENMEQAEKQIAERQTKRINTASNQA